MLEAIGALSLTPVLKKTADVLAGTVITYAFKSIKRRLTNPQKKALEKAFNHAFKITLAETAGKLSEKKQKEVGKLWQAFVQHDEVAAKLVKLALKGKGRKSKDGSILVKLANIFQAMSEEHKKVPIVVHKAFGSFILALEPLLEEEASNEEGHLFQLVTTERIGYGLGLLEEHDEHWAEALGLLREIRDAVTGKQAALPGRPNQLDRDLADFTGREDEKDRLLEVLGTGGGQAAIFAAIQGMGGIGKTALAVHVGHQVMNAYPDGQIQINLQGFLEDRDPLKPSEAMGRIIRAFEPEAKVPDDEASVSGLYRSMLAGKRALILLDNAADAAQVKPLLGDPPCGFVVTSRRRISLPGVEEVDLDTLPADEARDLLRKIVGEKRATDDDLDRVAKHCGHLPLALRTAGTFLKKHKDWPVDAYIEELDKEKARLKVEDHELDVAASLGVSARQLFRENPELAARWRLLTVFAATFEQNGVTAVWEVDEADARDGLSDLFSQSMLLFDEDTRRYRLHDLMRPVAQGVFTYADKPPSEDEQETQLAEAEARHAAYYCELLAEADRLYLEGGESVMRGLALADLEWDNILTGQAWAAAHAEDSEQAAELCNRYPDAGFSMLDLRLHARERVGWLESAFLAAKRLKDRQCEGYHLGNLGLAYADLGETRRAIEYHEQALKIDREIGDRRAEGQALGNLGGAYLELGDAHRAIEYYEQCLAIHREKGHMRGQGMDLCGLGLAYADLGDAHRAIEYYKQALTIHRETGDVSGEGTVLGNLGIVYRHLGDSRRAIEYFEQCLAIHRQIGDVRGEGIDLWNMSLVLEALGERDQAIANAQVALDIYERIEDPNADRVRKRLDAWRAT